MTGAEPEGVCGADPLSLPESGADGEFEGVRDAVADGVAVGVIDGDDEADAVVDGVPVPLADPPMDCVVVGVGELDDVSVAVSVAGADASALELAACVREGAALAVGAVGVHEPRADPAGV